MPREKTPGLNCTGKVQFRPGGHSQVGQALRAGQTAVQRPPPGEPHLKAHALYLCAMEAKRAWHAEGSRMIREPGPEDTWPSKLKAQRLRELKGISGQFNEARQSCSFSQCDLQPSRTLLGPPQHPCGPEARLA